MLEVWKYLRFRASRQTRRPKHRAIAVGWRTYCSDFVRFDSILLCLPRAYCIFYFSTVLYTSWIKWAYGVKCFDLKNTWIHAQMQIFRGDKLSITEVGYLVANELWTPMVAPMQCSRTIAVTLAVEAVGFTMYPKNEHNVAPKDHVLNSYRET